MHVANNCLVMDYLYTIVETVWHDDVITWKHFPHYWPFVRGFHRSPVNSPHKGQWLGALLFSLICARINGWVNNGGAGDLRRYRTYYDVIVMGNGISVIALSVPGKDILLFKRIITHRPFYIINKTYLGHWVGINWQKTTKYRFSELFIHHQGPII